ncbi:NADH dehydrogenase [Kiritimatiella glycovorans]|uniref:NADH dehydrogenase n=2 Tax=Kiritimatiella glycovorans TaxID=1307763 RepID=A0A0G3EEM3_9BACT|nr:NADH dehydrogenase [Kiritimatiella glycovorans]
METLEAVMTRRSVRRFEPRAVPDELLTKLLSAAMNAPSAADARPWQFSVIDDRAKLDALADAVDEGNDLFREAQAAILICGDESREQIPGFWPQDCACAAQNLQLAAHDQGLGTVWIALIAIPPRVEGCRRVLNVPGTLEPFALFPLGYPAERPEPENRFDADRVVRNGW